MSQGFKETIKFAQSDLVRYCGKHTVSLFIKNYICNSTFRWQVAFRLSKSRGALRYIGLILWKLNKTRKIIQIPLSVEIGYGLYIGHRGYIVINKSAKIGNNCNLSQFTTIGSNSGMAAHIGDNVYIGPGCCIVENVNIGDNVTIGAGSVVTKDIPDNATAAGNYAKVLNFENPGRYITNRWEGFDYSSK